jgi:hypothetical protein
MIGIPRVALSCACTGRAAGPIPLAATATAAATAIARVAGAQRCLLLGLAVSVIVCFKPGVEWARP